MMKKMARVNENCSICRDFEKKKKKKKFKFVLKQIIFLKNYTPGILNEHVKKIVNVRISAKIAGWGGDMEDDEEEDGGGE